MAQQMIGILTEQNVQRSLRELTSRDVLVTPDLGNADFLAFERARPNIEAGAAATRGQARWLAQWSVPPEAWAEYRRRRTEVHSTLAASPPIAAAVRVQRLDRDGAPTTDRIDAPLAAGDPVTARALSDAAEHLRREIDAERVEAVVVGDGPSREVLLLPVVPPVAGSRLRLGLELSSDFARNSEFTLSGLYTRTALTAAGAEWRTLMRAGAVNELQTEWYSPFAAGSRWFTSMRLGYRSDDIPIYDDALRQEAVTRASVGSVSAAFGLRLFDSGQVRLGTSYRRLRLQVAVPDTAQRIAINEYSIFVDLGFDTLDSLGFPARGFLVAAAAQYFGLGKVNDAPDYEQRYDSRFDGLYAASRGPWAGHLYLAGQSSALNFTVPLALGGFLRLSGSPPDSLIGSRLAFGRAVLARQVGTLPAAIGGAVRVGLSLEAGRIKPSAGLVSNAPRTAGSVFTVLETRFGPVYVGLGHTRHVGTSAYLFLGSVLLPSALLR
jgi:NTE family protein